MCFKSFLLHKLICIALDFRCQCTQKKLQSICAVLTFDHQLKKNLSIFCKRQISIKLFYLYQRLEYRDNYFFKMKFVFFLYWLLSALWNENDLPDRYCGTEHQYLFSRFLGVSILQLLIIYRIYDYEMLTLSQ
jgi:hypothetical protein